MKIDPTCNLLKKLEPPQQKIRMVLDTDTYNEVDDQFALAYSMCSPEKLNVEAIYAAPFLNSRSTSPGDGMEKSYNEIIRLLGKLNKSPDGFVFKGSETYLPKQNSPVDSPAARDLVKKAMESSEENPLYVVAIGAITNVASAILMEPEIINRIVVVWLGGHPHYWPHTHEFNLAQDIFASRVILNSGVPLVQIPCLSVASHLLTTIPELEFHLKGKNALCDYLLETVREYENNKGMAWAKEIWDISAIGYLVNPQWVPTVITHTPVLTDQCTWSIDKSRHFMKVATFVHRNPIFTDMFGKLSNIRAT